MVSDAKVRERVTRELESVRDAQLALRHQHLDAEALSDAMKPNHLRVVEILRLLDSDDPLRSLLGEPDVPDLHRWRRVVEAVEDHTTIKLRHWSQAAVCPAPGIVVYDVKKEAHFSLLNHAIAVLDHLIEQVAAPDSTGTPTPSKPRSKRKLRTNSLRKLTDEQKEAIDLRERGHSLSEIGKLLNIRPQSAYGRIKRGTAAMEAIAKAAEQSGRASGVSVRPESSLDALDHQWDADPL